MAKEKATTKKTSKKVTKKTTKKAKTVVKFRVAKVCKDTIIPPK